MAFQERDIERGLTEPPRDAVSASVDARSTVVTPPPGAMYTDPTQRSSPDAQQPMQTTQRPALTSNPSTFSFAKLDILSRYRNHLGIIDDGELTSKNRIAANVGMYRRVVTNEEAARFQYKLFACLINGALGLQIIFAAALTALGAGNGPRSAVTAFGAMNTIIAGFLTFLKGSGLPNRLKYYENEWTKVREYIEQRERDFAHTSAIDHDLNLLTEIAIIETMYENVRKDIENNTPDSYISMNKSSQPGTNPPPSLARGLGQYGQHAQAGIAQLQSGVRERYSQIQSGIDSKLREAQTYADDRLRDVRDCADDHMRHARDYTDSRYRETRGYFDEEKARAQSQVQEVQDATQTRVQEMQAKIKEGESKAKEMEEKVLGAAERAAGKVLHFIDRRKEGH